MQASWATAEASPDVAPLSLRPLELTFPDLPTLEELARSQEDASQLAPPLRIACPGLGATPLPGFEPDVTVLNTGSLQGYGPAQQLRDPYENGFKPFPAESTITATIRLVLADQALAHFMQRLTEGLDLKKLDAHPLTNDTAAVMNHFHWRATAAANGIEYPSRLLWHKSNIVKIYLSLWRHFVAQTAHIRQRKGTV
jgi:hypothetical protein